MDERPAKRNKDQGRISDDDRISQMPEHIIHNILSFLSARLGARIRILSKTFRRARDSLPIFNFDQFSFEWGLESVPLTDEEEDKYMVQSANKHFDDEAEKKDYMKGLRNKEHFLKHLDDSLQRVLELHLPIKTLRFSTEYLEDNDEECEDYEEEVEYGNQLTSRLDHWIGLASTKYVEKVEICLTQSNGEPVYSLPQAIVVAKSLNELVLVGCRLDQPFFRDTSLKFFSLRRFSLNRVRIDEQVIQNFIRSCPLIEVFSLSNCFGLKYYRVYGLHKLKKVVVVLNSNDVKNVDIVDIEAPSVPTLLYGCSSGLRALPSRMPKVNMDGCGQSLRALMLIGSIITDQLFQDVFSKCPLLETLHLWKCNMLERINISNSRLRTLALTCCRKLVVAVIDAPSLHHLKISTLAECFTSLGNVPEQTEVEIRIIDSGSMENWDTPWFRRLGEYLAAFKKIKSLTMTVPSGRSHSFQGSFP